LLGDQERRGSFDLEAGEALTKEVMLVCGALVLEQVLSEEGGSSERSCECGSEFVDRKRSEKTLLTVVGPVRLARWSQRCRGCGKWRVLADESLDVVGTGFSPGVRRMMAGTGAALCFAKSAEMIAQLAGLRVTAKEVERVAEAVGSEVAAREEAKTAAALRGEGESGPAAVATLYLAADGTGVPVLRRETEGRKGKGEDGIARTREAKLGAVFTSSAVDDEGRPVRDPGSTTYVGKIENVDQFGERLYAEADRRGLNQAKQVVGLGDGAPWVWGLFDFHFPGAVQIVDFYHAAEHLSGIARLLHPDEEAQRKAWFQTARKKLKRGRVAEIIAEVKSAPGRGKKKEEMEKALAYFEKNRERMRYDRFRKQGLFIGSGVVEAGCKSVIGARLKQSGMHWSVRGANAIIALRCCLESGGFEDYWESRRAA